MTSWREKLLEAMKNGDLAQLSQTARESSPLIESTYQPSILRTPGYTKGAFDYKALAAHNDD